jgi:MoaA/NifB/PqqE/SkfB family radical SAM enzyme|tara:strand:+ start:2927 stop:3958 length:1032 start_codon:yes stop_codon:yes gene_type:complete
LKRLLKDHYVRYYKYPKEWLAHFVVPNLHDPLKLSRAFKWAVLPKLRKFPTFIVIDPIVRCNLNCPLCSIPPKLLPNYGCELSLKDFKKTLDNIKSVTNHVFFSHAGEPFLNKQLLDMVELVNKYHMISSVGTNGTFLTARTIDRIFEIELDFLQISFDGFSKETYEKYRVKASFEKVLHNITELSKMKKSKKSKKPFISVTFLINAYNSHEIDDAAKYFKKMDIDFIPKGINLNLHRRKDKLNINDLAHWIDFENEHSMYRLDEKGHVIFKKPFKKVCDTCEKPVINCKGNILLCCHDIFNSVNLGKIYECEFEALWSSEHYTKLRKMASKRELPICKICGK